MREVVTAAGGYPGAGEEGSKRGETGDSKGGEEGDGKGGIGLEDADRPPDLQQQGKLLQLGTAGGTRGKLSTVRRRCNTRLRHIE